MEKINFVSNGKTGDLFHNLWVVKNICERENKTAVLYISEDTSYGGDAFHYNIKKTFSDLKPIMEYQSYISEFKILDSKIDNYINLNNWRHSGLTGITNWLNILSKTHSLPITDGNWIEYGVNEKYESLILIHRSTRRHSTLFPYQKIINQNKNVAFITMDDEEYGMFPYKDQIPQIKIKDFSDFVTAINSCKFFIGNMSTPLAIAHALGKPRLGELFVIDQVHYIGEEKYLNNYFYKTDNGYPHMDGIKTFINYE